MVRREQHGSTSYTHTWPDSQRKRVRTLVEWVYIKGQENNKREGSLRYNCHFKCLFLREKGRGSQGRPVLRRTTFHDSSLPKTLDEGVRLEDGRLSKVSILSNGLGSNWLKIHGTFPLVNNVNDSKIQVNFCSILWKRSDILPLYFYWKYRKIYLSLKDPVNPVTYHPREYVPCK